MTHVGKETTLGAVRFLRPILGLTQRILGTLPLDHPPELGANIGHHLEQRFIRLKCLTREELEHGGDLTSDQNRETEGGPDPGAHGRVCAGKVGIFRGIDDPSRIAGGQYSTGQTDTQGEPGFHAGRTEPLEALRVVEVPDVSWHELVSCIPGQGVNVTDRPSGVSANAFEAEPQRLLDRERLVGSRRDTLQQLKKGGLLTQIGYVRVDDDSPVVRCLAFADLYPAAVALQLKALTGMRPV